jgi:hypothetical protein
MGFEVFEGQRVRMTDDPTVTIQKRGNISINLPAFEALGTPENVELLYDRERRLMAIRKAADAAARSAYVLRPLKQRGRKAPPSSYLASGKAFAVFYGIPTDVAKRWTAQVEDDMLVVDLNEPGLEVTSNRNRNGNT